MIDQIKRVSSIIRESKNMICLTGAGVSTASGIPDFRTPGKGLWSQVNPFEVTSIEAFRRNPTQFYQFYQPRIEGLQQVFPNQAHDALVKLEKAGYLHLLITQNIDNLHQKAGSQKILEIHGNLSYATCMRCNKKIPADLLLKLIEIDKQKVPHCSCGGIFKPDVVLFGEQLACFQEAVTQSIQADLFLVIGSSLEVSPANLLPEYSFKQGGDLVIINFMKTHLDDMASVVVNQDIGLTLSKICQELEI